MNEHLLSQPTSARVTIWQRGDGAFEVMINARVHPKGSYRAIPSKNGPCPTCHRGYPVLVENDDHRKESTDLVKLIKAAWGDLPMIDGPVRYSALYQFVKPKTSKDPYPYHVGDIDKLQRRCMDWLAGSTKEPGPILKNDALVVETGASYKVFGERDAVLVTLERVGLI